MAFKTKPKVAEKTEPSVVNPKFKSERELVQFLKNSLGLTPAEKQKMLGDFREK